MRPGPPRWISHRRALFFNTSRTIASRYIVLTRLSASPTSWLRRLQLVSPALRTLRDAWRLAKGGVGSDDAYSRGTAQIGARRPRKPFPTMPWEQRRRPGSSRNTGTFLGLFAASYPRRGVILPEHLRPCLFKIAH
jgi:hypothetical protein